MVYYRLREGRLYCLLPALALPLPLPPPLRVSNSQSDASQNRPLETQRSSEVISKVPHSGIVEAGSFKPVRKHPLMLLCFESGPNEAQPCSALQPHACSHHQLPNSQLNRCLGEQLSCLGECSAQSFNNGRGELSYTHR